MSQACSQGLARTQPRQCSRPVCRGVLELLAVAIERQGLPEGRVATKSCTEACPSQLAGSEQHSAVRF